MYFQETRFVDSVDNRLLICKSENAAAYEAQTVILREELAENDGLYTSGDSFLDSDRTPIVLLHRLTNEEIDDYKKIAWEPSKYENENDPCHDNLSNLAERLLADSFEDVAIKSDDRAEDDDDNIDVPPPPEYPCAFCGLPFVCRTRLKKHQLGH